MRSPVPPVATLLCALLLSACGDTPVREGILDRDGRTRVELQRSNGCKQGEVIIRWANGAVRAKGQYDEDLRTGWWRTYHPDGAIATLCRYRDGEMDGIRIRWGTDGTLLRAEELNLGVPDGQMILFYPDGGPQQWSRYVEGTQNGPHYHWFREGDVPEAFLQGAFINGAQHGLWREQAPDGHITWETLFDHGRIVWKTVRGKRV